MRSSVYPVCNFKNIPRQIWRVAFFKRAFYFTNPQKIPYNEFKNGVLSERC